VRRRSFRQDGKRWRLLPMATMFVRLERVVRDLTRANGKEARLLLEGAQTELDRRIVEQLADPLAPNGQFTLQPNTPSVQRVTFAQPVDAARGSYSFAWQPDGVTFRSVAGPSPSRPAAAGSWPNTPLPRRSLRPVMSTRASLSGCTRTARPPTPPRWSPTSAAERTR
jgi:hypothetical protein